MVNGLRTALAETKNSRVADGLRRALDSRQSGADIDELGKQAYPRVASQPPVGSARRAHVETGSDGIPWATSQYSARNAEGELIPPGERSCVEVTVIHRLDH